METALSRILADVLALEDITEAESHRLCELCHIMNSLEGLFVEDPDEPSFIVSYVPSWLKFSYLSELLVRPLLVSNGNRQYRRHNSRKLRLRTFRICSKRALWWTLSATSLYGWSAHYSPSLPRERRWYREFKAHQITILSPNCELLQLTHVLFV